MQSYHLFIFCAILLLGCAEDNSPKFDLKEVNGYAPIYATENDVLIIGPVEEIENPGQIYVYNRYLLIVEKGRGFHIFDNINPSNPVQMGFFRIPYNHNISIKDGVLFADSAKDLLAITFDPDGNMLVESIYNVFEYFQHPLLPPKRGYYFECVEDDKGVVVGWRKTIIENPDCYY